MSKMKNWFFSALAVFILLKLMAFTICGQDFEVKIKLPKNSVRVADIEGKFLNSSKLTSDKNWVFARSVAGFEGLGDRISTLSLLDNSNEKISVKKLIAGEYLAEGGAAVWKYRINLESRRNFAEKAHISWLEADKGILMLRDTLPQFQNENGKNISAKVIFDLPEGWKTISSERDLGRKAFFVNDVENAIFLVGKGWRETEFSVGGAKLNIATFGEWNFLDKDSLEYAKEIFENYLKIFEGIPDENIQIILVPIENQTGRWQAETRGNNITIVSGDMPFKTRSLQRLHEQLRHELFHLWIPNDLALKGNYDWFYEGFAVYQSLRTAVLMNQIRFEDFLDTLGQAHYLANFSDAKLSLIEISEQNVSGANPKVYSKGMIVAFLCDAAILQKSKAKSSIEDIFREIYKKHNSKTEPKNANEAILKILRNRSELRPVVEKYIEGTEKIVLANYLDDLGIEALETDFETRLVVKEKLKSRQKDLLKKLGYNNWRKIDIKQKN